MEGVAVTTYKIDPENGTITVMIVDAGGSSSLVKNLKIDEPIIFMGPSGTPNHIAENKKVVLVAGGRGIFPLASLAKAHKENGCHTTLFCGFKDYSDLVRQDELKDSCDELVLAFENNVPQELFNGNIIDAVKNYFQSNDEKIDVLLTMGNNRMMDKVAGLYHVELKNNLNTASVGITNLNSPMQCMLKGVCSQCLQRKIDKKTGKERFFYACLGPDQKLDEIDFNFLKNRCEQNSLSEKLTGLWIKNTK
jgi:NAD(P)H-flavin reductase